MAVINVYTDGSSIIKGKFYESSSAAIIYVDDKEVYRGGVYHKNGTNSVGEVYAMVIGISKAVEIMQNCPELNDAEIHVYGDSDYVIKSLTSYIYGWKRLGEDAVWMSRAGTPVCHQQHFKFLYYNYLIKKKGYNIKFFHINSHIEPSKMKSAWLKYQARNETEIPFDEFKLHSTRNDKVDALVDMIRIDKIHFTERTDSDYIETTNVLRINNQYVIRR